MAEKTAPTPDMAIHRFQQRLIGEINGCGLPISVVNLVLTDILNNVRGLTAQAIALGQAAEQEDEDGNADDPTAGRQHD